MDDKQQMLFKRLKKLHNGYIVVEDLEAICKQATTKRKAIEEIVHIKDAIHLSLKEVRDVVEDHFDSY